MAYDYKGTKITGTSTTEKKFKKSGIKKASKGEKYFNTSTGHVYKCTEGGKAEDAKWKYLRTDIAHKPTVSVSSLGAPVRQSGTHKMKATWKTPDEMVNQKKGDRATALDINWFLGIAGKDPKEVIHTSHEKLTESTINLSNLKIGSKTYKRSSFYPFANKPKLNYVTVKVISKNAEGSGASAKNTRKFEAPRAPSISAFTFNGETGELSCTISTNPGDDYRERYDTKYKMTAYYSKTKKTSTIHDDATTATSKTIKFDDANYASRGYGEYVKVTVTAFARGYKGPSAPVKKSFYISYPAKATINDCDISNKTSSGRCIIYVTIPPSGTKEHPVDRVKLEILANTEYSDASQIPAGAGWEQTDIIDDAQCNALSVSVSELMPERGNYTWIRLKTYHANEAVLYRYSNPFRIEDLETPEATAADDKITIASATAGADGKSAVVQLGWDDGQLPSTGTELSWDTEEDAWKSTKNPEDYSFEWEDKTAGGSAIPVTVDGVTYPHSATITIKDLDEGEKYYVRARRYNEGDTTTYSEYSNQATVLTSERPESVAASADRYVPKGAGLNVYWTFSGNGLQTAWQIEQLVPSEEDPGTMVESGTFLKEGEGSLGSTQIDPTRLESLAIDGDITYVVKVSTGSDYVVSDPYTVTIIDPPTLSITAPSVMSQQPYSFQAIASVPSDLVVIVTSQGAAGQFPGGQRRQTDGDTIYSNVFAPVWISGYALTEDTELQDKRYYEYEDQEYVAVLPEGNENPAAEGWYEETSGVSTVVELPPGLDFWDLGSYSLYVTAIDRQTELRSDGQPAVFSVLWSHQAPSIEPTETYTLSADTEVMENKNYYSYDSETQVYTVVETVGDENPLQEGWYEMSAVEYVTVTPVDIVDESGFHHQAAQIALTTPPNALETDVYDIYRVTGDGARLIGESFPLNYTVTDEYAPFGEDMTNYYRIAVRTADGDVAFSDIEYVLEGSGIRLDWAGGFLEYPYGVSIEDSYKKDVDIRQHLDGGISGYWNQGIQRKGSLGTEAIKVLQKSDIELTRQLARYTGPVFVRTREGTAFQADVQISDLSSKNKAIMTIAIDATEIDLTDEFKLPTPFVLEEEEEEEQ